VIVKFGAPVTLIVTVVVCVTLPLLPVIVTVELPTVVPDVFATVNVEHPLPVTHVG